MGIRLPLPGLLPFLSRIAQDQLGAITGDKLKRPKFAPPSIGLTAAHGASARSINYAIADNVTDDALNEVEREPPCHSRCGQSLAVPLPSVRGVGDR